eukprot:1213050-Prymnesium_polylepis.1
MRTLFTDDEKEVFARALMLYGDMGWGLDYQNIRVMFAEAAAKAGRIDWKTGEPHVVSHAYVAEFVKSRPGLHAYKVSHVDPLRSKKATAKVCLLLVCPPGLRALCRGVTGGISQTRLFVTCYFRPLPGETLADF